MSLLAYQPVWLLELLLGLLFVIDMPISSLPFLPDQLKSTDSIDISSQ